MKNSVAFSASDPRNGVMMKMLAMVEYGERAGSGLQGIFKTWERVFHCKPQLEVSTSGGVDRTTLSLNFEGRQPDIEAMKRLYGDFGEISTQETEGKGEGMPNGTQESILTNKDKLISLLRTYPKMTLNEAAGKIGLTRDGIKKIADKLRAEGILSRKGSTKAGEWVVTEKMNKG